MGHNYYEMKPVFKEMIWGGRKLKDVFNYDIPSLQKIVSVGQFQAI